MKKNKKAIRAFYEFSRMIGRPMDWVSVGRKLLAVDPLPTGALPVYTREQVEEGALVIANRKRVKNGLRTIIPRHTANP
jgi:hypothetical protein